MDASEAAAIEALASGRRRRDLGLILNSLDLLARVRDRRGDLRESLYWQRRCLTTAAVYKAPGQQYLAVSCVAVLRMRARRSPAGAIAADDSVNARRHAERALAIFRKMDVPEQQEVEKWPAGEMSGSVWW